MNLEQQCVSLDLAKHLKELGVKQESYFCHAGDIGIIPSFHTEKLKTIPEIWGDAEKYINSAFTAAELLELLPYHITTKEPEPFNSYRLYISGSIIVKNPECIDPIRIHIVNYKLDSIDMENKQTILSCALGVYLTKNLWDENPANAFAKMLIFLYEQGLITDE